MIHHQQRVALDGQKEWKTINYHISLDGFRFYGLIESEYSSSIPVFLFVEREYFYCNLFRLAESSIVCPI